MPGASQSALQLTTGGEHRTADILLHHLVVHEGVDTFFGLPGGAISPLDDAIFGRVDARLINVRHESDAVFAAAGYARATGKVGVAMVTSGPGVLNALNALASAHLEGLPVLLLAGEAATPQQNRGALQDGGPQALDVVHMARSITQRAVQLATPESALLQLVAVIEVIKRGPQGAGLVTCPSDILRARTARCQVSIASAGPSSIDEGILIRAARALASGDRPLIFAGNGLRTGDGPAALRALAEQLQAPVITTPHAKGVFPESHPLSLGIYGLALHPSAVRFLEGGFDRLLAVGTSLSELATNGFSPTLRPRGEDATTIQVDLEAGRMGRAYPVDIAILGDAAMVLRGLADRLPERDLRRYGLERSPLPGADGVGPEGRITPQRAVQELQAAMPAGTAFTVDSGEHTLHVLHHLHVDDPRGFMVSLGLGSMGSGIGTALGLAAAKNKPVVAVAGDGGFAMSLSAIATAANARLPVLFAIFNDGRYAMCEAGYRALYGRSFEFSLGPLDIGLTAEGLGAQSIRIDEPGQLAEHDLLGKLARGPVVLDIHIDRSVRVLSGARVANILRDRSSN